MKAQRFTFVVLLFAGIAGSNIPARASCPIQPPPDQEFAESEAVFVGRIVAQRIVPDPRRDDDSGVTEWSFEVEQLWKGQSINKIIPALSCGWSDGFTTMTCSEDPPLRVGSRFVVFADTDPKGNLWVGGCGWTEPVESATAKLTWLSTKPSQPVN